MDDFTLLKDKLEKYKAQYKRYNAEGISLIIATFSVSIAVLGLNAINFSQQWLYYLIAFFKVCVIATPELMLLYLSIKINKTYKRIVVTEYYLEIFYEYRNCSVTSILSADNEIERIIAPKKEDDNGIFGFINKLNESSLNFTFTYSSFIVFIVEMILFSVIYDAFSWEKNWVTVYFIADGFCIMALVLMIDIFVRVRLSVLFLERFINRPCLNAVIDLAIKKVLYLKVHVAITMTCLKIMILA